MLTGGPGCGKSFTVRSVVELATAKKATVVLVAPTGRAAKRLAELTGHEASTVHRLLELQPGGDPKYDRDNPLDADLVVVDECSMMDVILANKLVKAIPPRSAPAAGRRRRPAPLGRRRRSPARPARRRGHPAGAPDPDLPPSPPVRHRRQRPPHQPRPAPAAHRLSATSTGSPATPPRTPACTQRRRPPNSSWTSSPAASPPNSGSTRSATSKY